MGGKGDTDTQWWGGQIFSRGSREPKRNGGEKERDAMVCLYTSQKAVRFWQKKVSQQPDINPIPPLFLTLFWDGSSLPLTAWWQQLLWPMGISPCLACSDRDSTILLSSTCQSIGDLQSIPALVLVSYLTYFFHIQYSSAQWDWILMIIYKQLFSLCA